MKGLLHFKKKNNKQVVGYSEELLRNIPEPKKQEILSELEKYMTGFHN